MYKYDDIEKALNKLVEANYKTDEDVFPGCIEILNMLSSNLVELANMTPQGAVTPIKIVALEVLASQLRGAYPEAAQAANKLTAMIELNGETVFGAVTVPETKYEGENNNESKNV